MTKNLKRKKQKRVEKKEFLKDIQKKRRLAMNKKLGETKQFLSRAKTLKMIIVQLNSIFAQEYVFKTSSKFFEY